MNGRQTDSALPVGVADLPYGFTILACDEFTIDARSCEVRDFASSADLECSHVMGGETRNDHTRTEDPYAVRISYTVMQYHRWHNAQEHRVCGAHLNVNMYSNMCTREMHKHTIMVRPEGQKSNVGKGSVIE